MALDTTVIPRTTDVNTIVDNVTLDVNGSSLIQVKDSGIPTGKIAPEAVETSDIKEGNVTGSRLSASVKSAILCGFIPGD